MPGWNEEELKELWRKLFRGEVEGQKKYGPLIREAADNYPQTVSVEVQFSDIVDFNRAFAEMILETPKRIMGLGETAMKDFMHADRKVGLRMHFVDVPAAMAKLEIRNIRAAHLDRLISVEGLVRRVTEVRPMLKVAVFQCQRCNEYIRVEEFRKDFEEPLHCPKDQGGCGRAASATRFVLQMRESEFIDTQSVEVQEFPEGLPGGAQPQRLTIYMDSDLTGKVTPGDRITFNGILKAHQLKDRNAKSTVFEKYIECVGIRRSKEDFEEIDISPEDEETIIDISRGDNLIYKIAGSIAPSIKGLEKEKLALALQLFGGVRKEIPDGYLRGDIHILMVGDPGTAKSQLLNYISMMSPRGVMTSGKSATAAGLTAAAVPDEHEKGRWNLEAGALVLADKGIVCIDEIDKMSKQDRSSMHEAMEQQRVSITKAGIQATLQSRCSVLGAANPKMGRFTANYESLTDEINMLPTLLDRFDIIFTIRDKPDREKDRGLAEHVLRTHRYGEILRYREAVPYGKFGKEEAERAGDNIEPIYPRDLLRKYIAYAKKNVFPVMTKEAMAKIMDYYVDIRSTSREGVVACTARQLEAIIRFSEACAKAHLSEEVGVEFVDVAIDLVRYYLETEASIEMGGIDRISSHMTHSQRSSVATILQVINDLEGEYEEYAKGGVPEAEIINRCELENISKDIVTVTLYKLTESGDVYKPRSKKYKLLEKM